MISTDFYPSLLEMAGLPARDEQALDGVSFVPALNGELFNRGPIFWHFPQYSNHGMQSRAEQFASETISYWSTLRIIPFSYSICGKILVREMIFPKPSQ